jgi:hypothetical protein
VLASLSAHKIASESNSVGDKINELLSHSVLDNISSIYHFTLQRHHCLKPIKQAPGRASTSPGSSVCLCKNYLIGLPNRNSKEYVPRPVTGSHPELAEKPFVLQPGLSPVVMSWRTLGLAYCSIMISSNFPDGIGAWHTKVGFTNPTVDFPAAIRSSLMRLRIAAKTGAAAEVPPIKVGRPALKMTV